MYLLDTNVVINFLDASMPPSAIQFLNTIVDEQSNITVITKIETLGYNFKSIEEKNTVAFFVNASTVYELNEAIVNQTIDIRKAHKIKLPDAIIGATALVYNLTLITRNTSDFKHIDGIKVINPFEL
jgi:predicted nucleic acid-binding protein